MVWYYCEICNKNVNVSADAPYCATCQFQLSVTSLEASEIARRRKTRAVYCRHCDMMVTGVPTGVMVTLMEQRIQYAGGPTYVPRQVFSDDARCVLLVVVLATLGLALIPILVYYYAKRDVIDAANSTQGAAFQANKQTMLTTLSAARANETRFPFVCNRCFNFTSPDARPPEADAANQKATQGTKFCELCGTELRIDAQFCTTCGAKALTIVEDEKSHRYIPADVRRAVWERDGGRCVRCGATKALQFDHLIPWSKGGASIPNNLQLLCANCNSEKRDRIDG